MTGGAFPTSLKGALFSCVFAAKFISRQTALHVRLPLELRRSVAGEARSSEAQFLPHPAAPAGNPIHFKEAFSYVRLQL